jgi:threonine/homoserine/homoserine lactone efflux protein
LVDLIIGGVGLGLVLSIMLGPVFFILLETSIKKGVRSAFFLDLGVLLSDLMYISLAYVFVNQVAAFKENENIYWLLIIGGAVFIVFGFMTMRNKVPRNKNRGINPNDLTSNNYFTTMVKGFFLNAVNPGVLFYWGAIIGRSKELEKLGSFSKEMTELIYVGVILLTFFTVDIFKIFGAKKLKNVLTPAWMKIINRVLGIILVCIGFIFLFQGILSGIKGM